MQATVHVKLPEREYPVNIGYGILQRLGYMMSVAFEGENGVLIITDRTVGKLHLDRVIEQLKGRIVSSLVLPPGERTKALSSAKEIWKKMLENRMQRGSTVIALGGGVVGDVAGFAASTYMRGVNLVMMPTDLIAMVDSSIGGKNAIDFAGAKNIIGTFYQPSLVFSELNFLETLPEKEYRSGLAEVIKYGVIMDAGLFGELESKREKVLAKDKETLFDIVVRCAAMKAKLVEEDEYDRGARRMLNFGHTLGHALEAETGFSRYTHGEAVALGMCLEARISVSRGLLKEKVAERIVKLLASYGLPTKTYAPIERLVARLKEDKKSLGSKIALPLPKGLGIMENPVVLDEKEVMRALK